MLIIKSLSKTLNKGKQMFHQSQQFENAFGIPLNAVLDELKRIPSILEGIAKDDKEALSISSWVYSKGSDFLRINLEGFNAILLRQHRGNLNRLYQNYILDINGREAEIGMGNSFPSIENLMWEAEHALLKGKAQVLSSEWDVLCTIDCAIKEEPTESPDNEGKL